MTENITPNLDRHSPDYEFRPFPGDQPPAPKKQWFKNPLLLIPVGALLLGVAIGGANTPEPVTVTKEVPGPERIVEKRVEVKVPTAPASCREALDLNEQAFTHLSTSLGHVMDGDYTAANAATEKVKALVPKVNAAKADCRAAQ